MTVEELVKSDMYKDLLEKHIEARKKAPSCVTVKEYTDCFTDILDLLYLYEKYDFFKGYIPRDSSDGFRRDLEVYKRLLDFVKSNYSDDEFPLKYDKAFRNKIRLIADERKIKHKSSVRLLDFLKLSDILPFTKKRN